MITLLALFLLFGATYRLTRLTVADTITERLRQRLLGKFPETHWFRELMKCFWCMSMWWSFLIWGAWELFPIVVLALAIPLTLSTIIGFSARMFDY